MDRGVVEQINIGPDESGPIHAVPRVRAVVGYGLEGDRYYTTSGSGDVTLVAAEALEAFRAETGIELSAAESRRQVLTRGIDLDALVGRRFRIGEVLCEGVELCHPCRHLERLTQPGVLRGMVNRGGLRADIIEGGRIAVGDTVSAQELETPALQRSHDGT